MPEALNSPAGGAGGISVDRTISDEQTPDEQQLAKFVFDRYLESKKFRATYDKDWERWYRYYSGQQWEGPRPEWRSTPVVNFIFAAIETILPIMTDSSPQINVVPSKPQGTKMSEVFGQIVKRVWTDNSMDTKLPQIIKNTLKYGTGIAKVWWNPHRKNGIGEVEVSVVDPRHFFPSPGAIDIEDAEYVIFAANVPMSFIERDFPECVCKIRGGIWDEDLTVNKNITSQRSGSIDYLGPVQNTSGSDVTNPREYQQGRDGMLDRSKIVTFIECWHKDEHGDAVVTMMANGVLLKHGPSPFRHNRFPFVKFIDYCIPSMFWGMGEIQQLEKLQDNINQRRAQTIDILKLTANPPFVADADSGVNPKAMTNRPATIIFKNRDSQVNWLQPPQLPGALFELQNLDKADFDAISGIFDVTQGRRPVGIEAASAITELQEAAQTRIRLKVRNMEAALRQVGQLIVSLVQQFYTEERTIRIVSPSSSKPEFITLNQVGSDPITGSPIKINDTSIGEYDIEIGVGSTMPVNKTRRAEQMIELFQLGVVDARAVLENAGMSPEEYERILQRMQAQEQMAMQAQAAQPVAGSEQPVDDGLPTQEELAQLEAGA